MEEKISTLNQEVYNHKWKSDHLCWQLKKAKWELKIANQQLKNANQELKNANQELKKANQKLEKASSHTPSCLVTLSPHLWSCCLNKWTLLLQGFG